MSALITKPSRTISLSSILSSFPLKGEELVLLKSALLEVRQASKFDHRWGSAHEDLNAFRSGGEALRDHLLGDEPGEALPSSLGGPIDGVENLEPSRVVLGVTLELKVEGGG